MHVRICEINSDVPSAYGIEVHSSADHWLAEVTPTPEADLLVEVYELAAPPEHVIEDYVLRIVNRWRVCLQTRPDEIAAAVSALLNRLQTAA